MSEMRTKSHLPRFSVFIATSIDGFIAREDGSIDWLNDASSSATAGEDFGYSEVIKSVDAIVIGRGTFEHVLSFPSWPYGSMPVYVLSHTLTCLPPHLPSMVTLHSGTPSEIAEALGERGHTHVYVDGGRTIHGFIVAGLVSTLTITTIPILLGSGRPLFGALQSDVALKLLSAQAFNCGFVQSRYIIDERG